MDRIKETGNSGVFKGDLGKILGSWLVASMVPPLGHGRAQIFPDLSFLSWEYKNGKKKKIPQNKTEIFFEAANEMCRFMQKYREVPVKGLPAKDASEIKRLFTEVKDEDGDKRHKAWIDAIKSGNFSFGPSVISYDDRGNNSWKAKALGTAYDLPVHTYRDDFLDSDWKMFHDALQQHRLTLLHTILPKYGICAA